MARIIVTMQQQLNEYSSHVFVRAAKKVRVGQVLHFVKHPQVGGPDTYWLKVDARSNDGRSWITYTGKVA